MEALVRRFVEELQRTEHCQLLLNAPVTDVDLTDAGPDVSWREGANGGRPRRDRFDYVVCAVPAPNVQRIRFRTDNDPNRHHRAEALAGITYGSAAKSLIHVRRRPWERDDILGGATFTDLPIQQIWYPSDAAEEGIPAPDEPPTDAIHQDEGAHAFPIEPATQAGQELPADIREYGQRGLGSGIEHPPRLTQPWDKPGVLTAAYIWGSAARRLGVLSADERSRVVLDALEVVHPGISAEVDAPPVHRVWDNESSPGDGAYALFGPGEGSRHQRALSRPIRDGAGHARIYFAGEHLAIAHGWIQSAMQSALACVMHLLDALPPD